MKKITMLFTLIVSVAITTLAATQDDTNFAFVDADGNEVADGTTLNLNALEQNVDGADMIPSGLWVKNLSGGTSTYLRVNYTITQIDNGSFQICFPTTCNTQSAVGAYSTSQGSLLTDATSDLQAEWLPIAEGECVVALQIETFTKTGTFPPKYTHKGYGPTVTLHFNRADSSIAIGDVNGDGIIDINDVTALIGAILGNTTIIEDAADVNGDGITDINDVTALIGAILGK